MRKHIINNYKFDITLNKYDRLILLEEIIVEFYQNFIKYVEEKEKTNDNKKRNSD